MNAIFVTVRTGSTRLPNKAKIKINGKRTIQRVVDRMKNSKFCDSIVLCTTEREEDDWLCELARDSGICFYRGSSEDKLERWNGACKEFSVDYFVTADGDDLFCEPKLIDKAFSQFADAESDVPIEFIKSDGIICGAFTYGIKRSALEKVCEIKDSSDTEMMWVYFTETGIFNVSELENVDRRFYRDDIRMTLDYKNDLHFFESVIEYYEKQGVYDYCLEDIVDLIDKKPELAKINIHLQEEWKKNQDRKTTLSIREE